MRHNQGDQWDVLVLYPMPDRVTSSDSAFDAQVVPHLAWREDVRHASRHPRSRSALRLALAGVWSGPYLGRRFMTTTDTRLQALAATRWRVALTLTALMVIVYFGFISLIAFDKPLLAVHITAGLSLGILLGVVVIVATWLLTWIYVRWANRHYDAELRRLRQ